MLKTVLGLFAGGSPWGFVIAGLIAVAVGTYGGYEARGVIDAPIISDAHAATSAAKFATQQCVAEHEKARADSSEKVVTAMSDAAHGVMGALDALNAAAAARQQHDSTFIKELSNAPKTSVCSSSAAERAYRDSVRPPTGTGTTAP